MRTDTEDVERELATGTDFGKRMRESSDITPGRLRFVYLTGGCLFVALAVLGAVLPVLPTTPFLLLASFCFARSSPRLNAWLHRSRLFGPLLADWEKHRGVRLQVKLTAVTAIVLAVTASLYSGTLPALAKWLLIILATTGLCVVLRLPTVTE